MGLFFGCGRSAALGADRRFQFRPAATMSFPTKQEAANAASGGGSEPMGAPLRPRSRSGYFSSGLREAGKGHLCSRSPRRATRRPRSTSTPTTPKSLQRSKRCRMRKTPTVWRSRAMQAVSENYPELKSNANFLALDPLGRDPKTALLSRDATTFFGARISNTTLRLSRVFYGRRQCCARSSSAVPFTANPEAEA